MVYIVCLNLIKKLVLFLKTQRIGYLDQLILQYKLVNEEREKQLYHRQKKLHF